MSISEQNLELLPDYEQRIAVLQDLEFIDENSTVLLKGRVACEVRLATARGSFTRANNFVCEQINTGHELILTELILDNFLAGYEPEEAVALLSAFVFQERRSEVEPQLTPRLEEVSHAFHTRVRVEIADRDVSHRDETR